MQRLCRGTSNENVGETVRWPGGCSSRSLLTAMKGLQVRRVMLTSWVELLSRIHLVRHTRRRRLQMTDGLTGVELLEVRRTAIEASALVATARMHSPMLLPLQLQLDAGSKI